jgi:DNA polymerase-4
MRIACVTIPDLGIQVAVSGRTSWRTEPVVIGGQPVEASPVYDASAAAKACGVRQGMPLHEAYALCPHARFLPLNESRYGEASEQVADILERYSPVVEVESPSCAYFEVVRTSGELALAGQVLGSISAEAALEACLGVSNSRFISRAAALTSAPGAPVIVPENEDRDFIAPFSIDFLPCSPDVKERLRLLGIRNVGQLNLLSKGSLVAQFGREGAIISDLSQGSNGYPLVARKKPEVISVAIEIYPPATTSLQVLHHCEIVLQKPLAEVRKRGKACRELLVRVNFDTGASEEKRLPFRQTTTSISTIQDRIRVWLEDVEFPSQVTGLDLSLYPGSEEGEMLSLWRERLSVRPELNRLASKLKTRFGYQPLKKFEVADSHAVFPERRFKLEEVWNQEVWDD